MLVGEPNMAKPDKKNKFQLTEPIKDKDENKDHRGNALHCALVPPRAVFLGSQLVIKQKWRIGDRRRAVALPTIGWRDNLRADTIHSLGMKTSPIGDSSAKILVPDRTSVDHVFHDRGFYDYRYEGYENRLEMLNGKVKPKDPANYFTFTNSTNIFKVKRDTDPKDSPNPTNYPEEFRADLLTSNFLIIKCGDPIFSKPDYKAISKDSNNILNNINSLVFNALWNAIGIHLYRNRNCTNPNFNCSFKRSVAEQTTRDPPMELRPTEKLCLKIHLFIKMAKQNDSKSEMTWYRVDENDLVDITAQLDKEYHFRKKGLTADGSRREVLDLKGKRQRGIQQFFVLLTQGKNSSNEWQPYFVLEEAYCDGDRIFP
jgi:hypothetical protein